MTTSRNSDEAIGRRDGSFVMEDADNVTDHVQSVAKGQAARSPENNTRIGEIIASGSSAFEALQGQPPLLLGHAPSMRKGAFRAQRAGEHAVAVNLLLLSLQYEPLPKEALNDIDDAIKRVGSENTRQLEPRRELNAAGNAVGN